ncbi:MAG: hypothetical protein KatS3mg061_1629 [Dehalococcoidia bacterium]|nr:MAG: hypothetical protein KatS3mg061_1629 [Dehalococcoidia bacterium]
MNIFNRLIVILLMLFLILCSALTILALALYQGEVVDIFRQVAAAYPRGVSLETEVVIGLGVLAAVVALLAAIVLWFEIVPSNAPGVRLQSVGGANAIVTTEAIVQRVRYEAEQVPGVRQARASMRTNGREAALRVDARLASDAPVAPLVDQIASRVREAIETQMGIRIRRLDVYVSPEPMGSRPTGAERAPSGLASPSAPVVAPLIPSLSPPPTRPAEPPPASSSRPAEATGSTSSGDASPPGTPPTPDTRL